MTKYEIIEGDHWKLVGSYDSLEEADQECDRLNAEFNRDYFIRGIQMAKSPTGPATGA